MMKKTIFSVATLTAITGVSAVTASAEEVTVKSGDSLWNIAQAAGTTVADLKAENNLKSDLIHPGDVLSFNQTVEVSKDTYTVKAGDTLWEIGNEVGLSYQEIMTINNLNSDMIYPGQTLSLVASVEKITQTSETATVQEVEIAEEVTQVEETQVKVVEEVEATETVEVQETGVYIVQKGDTLASISRATGVDVDTLKALNSLTSDMIFPDDLLVLTGEVPTTPAIEEVSEVEGTEVAVETVDETAEQAAAEKAEADRVAAEQAAAEKAEANRVAAEQAAARKVEADRQAAIKAEEERVAAQRAEEARIQVQKEQQRIAAQKAAEKREREAAEQAQQASQPVTQGNGNAYTIALNLSKGKSYVYGANSAYAVDCSSFAQQFMAQYKGKNIPRTTWAQRDAGTKVSNPQPGDLVFFNNYSHVGVYVGNGMMVDALNPSEGVGLRAVSYVHGYVDGYYRY